MISWSAIKFSLLTIRKWNTAWKVSKYGVFSGPYFHACGQNTERYSVSPYSIRMRENTDQKKLRVWTIFTQWKSGMRYCVINIHNIKPKIHFRGWFIWKYCHFLLGDRGGREFFNISEKEWQEGWQLKNS